MKIRFKFKKKTGVLASLLASASFIWLATARLGLPKEKIYEWFFILFVLLLVIVVSAAVVGLLLRWVMGRKNS